MENQNYVKGRAGELATKANERTFELIREIFGKNGPYRRIMYKFGMGNPFIKEDFVILRDGEVLTDIDQENRIMWESVMYKLVKKDGKLVPAPDISIANIIMSGTGLIKKILIDSWIILNIDNYLENSRKRYKRYCEFTKKVLEEKKIYRHEFLKEYENVVYVTYLYELIFEYNISSKKKNKTVTAIQDKCLKGYVNKNDKLIGGDSKYGEYKYKNDVGFGLGETGKEKLFGTLGKEPYELISCEIEDCECDIPKLIKAEKVLQCLKDNMRLKTQTQLFVMNYQNNN